MPCCAPPSCYDGAPNRYLLGRGTCLWRVHNREYPAGSFKGVPSDSHFGGARFDATAADDYPFYYAALDQMAALAETLLRDLHPDGRGMRLLTGTARAERRLAGLTLTQDIELISLIDGKDLAAIGQDAWLVTASGAQYAQTRAWAHWLRGEAKWAQGIIWDSLRDRGRLSVVLFGDRLAATFGPSYERVLLHEVPDLAVELDDPAQTGWLKELLEPYRVTVEEPRTDPDGGTTWS